MDGFIVGAENHFSKDGEHPMKTVVYRKYGGPEVLRFEEAEKPIPKENEVLVKVHSTSVTTVDVIFRKGSQWAARGFTGITQPKFPILGSEFAGEIEAVGDAVKSFKPGDEIIAATEGYGSYAEYICLPETAAIGFKPENLSFTEAGTLPGGALTALPFLRDVAKIKPHQKILIIGASGSVGSYAVQFGKYFEAEVTGVCSTTNVELLKSLGADRVIDYRKEDFTQGQELFDVVFDAVGKSSFSACKKILKKEGIYLTTVLGLPILIQTIWTSLFGTRKAKVAFTGLRSHQEKTADLQFIKGLVEKGKLKPVIDQTFPLDKISEAHAYVEKGHKKGNVAVMVSA
jgi:NADPH:quinone reductase-like Zn-dependent oxidoreductase